MLPPEGSREHQGLQAEAILIGLASLALEDGDIPNALYRTYMTFRLRFIEERGLMDTRPGQGEEWRDSLEDARALESHVGREWAAVLVRGALWAA